MATTNTTNGINATSATGTSSIDVNSIVSQLMTVEQQPITKLNAKEASYQAKLSAYGSVKGSAAGFQTALNGLNSASKFNTLKVTPADTSVVSASATSIAVAGSYSLEVTSLAQSQRLLAAGQSSSTATIGTGASTTVTFDFGTITGNTFNSTTSKYGSTLSAATTNGSTTVTVASTANLAVGATITGAGIPVGATIASITDATNFVISAAATATGTGVSLQAAPVFTSNGNGSKSVTLDSTNNSLQGIRDAINAAAIGVTATIINDGNATVPYRLVLSSDSNGASNSMKITTSGDATINTLLANDPAGTQNLAETTAGQNAVFKVNGVPVSKTSNSVSDVIQGVTLNLIKTTTSATNITVARDTAGITESINGLVKAYNDLNATLKNLTSYDASTKKGAALQGDSMVRTLQTQLRSILSTPVAGATGGIANLSDVGVTFQKDGTLALNSTKLNSVMSSNFTDIAGLFASVGKATDSLVSYNSASSVTKPGNYDLNVTRIATQGTVVGGTAANTTITAAVNDALTFSVNGLSAAVTLTAGTYTATTLAAELQSKVNSVAALSAAGVSVTVTQNAGILTVTSTNYGSTSAVGITGGNGATDLMGIPTTTAGVDVAGTIGGIAASGLGQTLSAVSGNATGLSAVVNGGALGTRGTVSYSYGYASLLSTWSSSILGTTGSLASATDGINKSILDIGKRRTEIQARLVDVEKRYRTQFTALDSMLTSMNQTSIYLTQQLARL